MIDAILKQIARIPLPITRLAQHNRLGEHPSRQRGPGFDFDQLKEYQQGDPARNVNWAAMARKGNGTPLVNTYYEEKDSTVMLLVDLSASMNFGSYRLTKKTLTAEICASLVYSALCAHDQVGFMGFASDVMCYAPPRHSWRYQHSIADAILTSRPSAAPVNFAVPVTHLERWLKQPSLVFLLSDFLTEDLCELRQALIKLRRRHDLIPLRISDPLETSIPAGQARFVTRDLETGKRIWLSFTRKNQLAIESRMRSHATELHAMFHRMQLPYLTLSASSNYVEALTQLFLTCHRRASA